MADYSRTQLTEVLEAVGVRRGDLLFVHSNIGYFGVPESGKSLEAAVATVAESLLDAVGSSGTIVVPTFTYSFPRGEVFDPSASRSTCGALSESIRVGPAARRSCDPIFSVAAMGRLAEELTASAPPDCFGPGSFWDLLLEHDGLICNLNFDAGSTFVHYVEKRLRVPYRYDKAFTGVIVEDGKAREGTAIHFVHDLSRPETGPAFEPVDRLAQQSGVAIGRNVGRGQIVAIRASGAFQLISDGLRADPWLLTQMHSEAAVGSRPAHRPTLPLTASGYMEGQESAVLRSAGHHGLKAIERLEAGLNTRVFRYQTGDRGGGCIIPEVWRGGSARVKDSTGRVVASSTDGTVVPARFSRSFNGRVTRAEMIKRILGSLADASLDSGDALMYRSGWGLFLDPATLLTVPSDEFLVEIDASTYRGESLVVEVLTPPKNQARGQFVFSVQCPDALESQPLPGTVRATLDLAQWVSLLPVTRYEYVFVLCPDMASQAVHLSRLADRSSRPSGILIVGTGRPDRGVSVEYSGGDDGPLLKAARTVLERLGTAPQWSAVSHVPACRRLLPQAAPPVCQTLAIQAAPATTASRAQERADDRRPSMFEVLSGIVETLERSEMG